MLVHAALLTILALITLPERPPEKNIVAVANPNDLEDIEDLESEEIDSLDVEKFEGEAPRRSWTRTQRRPNSIYRRWTT